MSQLSRIIHQPEKWVRNCVSALSIKLWHRLYQGTPMEPSAKTSCSDCVGKPKLTLVRSNGRTLSSSPTWATNEPLCINPPVPSGALKASA